MKFTCSGDTSTERLVSVGRRVAGSVTASGVTDPGTKLLKPALHPDEAENCFLICLQVNS